MRDFDAIIAVNSGNPNTKFAREVAAARAKAAKPKPSEAEVLQRAINNFNRKVARTEAWVAECREDGQQNEAERWQTWLEEHAYPWLAEQAQKLNELHGT